MKHEYTGGPIALLCGSLFGILGIVLAVLLWVRIDAAHAVPPPSPLAVRLTTADSLTRLAVSTFYLLGTLVAFTLCHVILLRPKWRSWRRRGLPKSGQRVVARVSGVEEGDWSMSSGETHWTPRRLLAVAAIPERLGDVTFKSQQLLLDPSDYYPVGSEVTVYYDRRHPRRCYFDFSRLPDATDEDEALPMPIVADDYGESWSAAVTAERMVGGARVRFEFSEIDLTCTEDEASCDWTLRVRTQPRMRPVAIIESLVGRDPFAGHDLVDSGAARDESAEVDEQLLHFDIEASDVFGVTLSAYTCYDPGDAVMPSEIEVRWGDSPSEPLAVVPCRVNAPAQDEEADQVREFARGATAGRSAHSAGDSEGGFWNDVLVACWHGEIGESETLGGRFWGAWRSLLVFGGVVVVPGFAVCWLASSPLLPAVMLLFQRADSYPAARAGLRGAPTFYAALLIVLALAAICGITAALLKLLQDLLVPRLTRTIYVIAWIIVAAGSVAIVPYSAILDPLSRYMDDRVLQEMMRSATGEFDVVAADGPEQPLGLRTNSTTLLGNYHRWNRWSPEFQREELEFIRFDAESREFRSWAFYADGRVAHWTGRYREAEQMLEWSGEFNDGSKGRRVLRSVGEGRLELQTRLSGTNPDSGATTVNWVRRRGKSQSPQLRLADPRAEGQELEKYESLAGIHDLEVTSRPSRWTPDASHHRGRTYLRWTVGGRFLLEESHVSIGPSRVRGERQVVRTYDAATGRYRCWHFADSLKGELATGEGSWDDSGTIYRERATFLNGLQLETTITLADARRAECETTVTDAHETLFLDEQRVWELGRQVETSRRSPDRVERRPGKSGPGSVNLMRTATCTASSSGGEAALDGDVKSHWVSEPTTESAVWLAAHWERPVTIHKIVLREAHDRIIDFDIEEFDAQQDEWNLRLRVFGQRRISSYRWSGSGSWGYDPDRVHVDGRRLEDLRDRVLGQDEAGYHPTFTINLPQPLVTTGLRLRVRRANADKQRPVSLYEFEAY